jgi:plastocyanin
MQQLRTPRPALALIAFVLATGIVAVMVTGAFAMSRSDWGMGSGGQMGGSHMGHMMGGGANTSNAPVSVGSAAESIAIRNFAFAPGNLQVPVGATVTFTNYDDAPHSATAKDGSWDTGILNKGESKTITFDKPGDYTYYCKVHPSMVARLQVR